MAGDAASRMGSESDHHFLGGYALLLYIESGLDVLEAGSGNVGFRGGDVVAVRKGLGQVVHIDGFAVAIQQVGRRVVARRRW